MLQSGLWLLRIFVAPPGAPLIRRGMLATPAIVAAGTTAASEAVDLPPAPSLSFHAGGLAALAIAIFVLLVAVVWTLFVAGIWTSSRKRARTRLRQRELELDLAFDNISQGLCMFDARARIVVCNKSFLTMYGLSPDVAKPGCTLLELLQHRADVGFLAENPEQYARDILASIAKGESTTWVIETRDGRFIHAINHPIPGGGWVTTHEDITQRRLAELALDAASADAERARADQQIAHQRLREAFEAVPEGVVLFDADDRLVMWNRRYAEMYPATKNITVGTRFEDLLWDGIAHGQYPAAKGRESAFVAQRLAQHNQARSSVEQELPDNRWVRAEERRTADGGIIGVRIDVTDLKNREASFRLLFERNPVPMWVFGREHLRFLAVNDAAVEHYGYSREEFLSMSAVDMRPPEERDEFRRLAGRGSRSYSEGRFWHHLKADGTKIDVAIFSTAMTYEGQAAVLVAAMDVTERSRAEARLRDTQEFLDTILENIPVSIFVKKVDDLRYVLINRASEQLMGIPRERMLGKTAHEVFPLAAADIVAENDERRLASNEQVFFEEIALETPGNDTRLVEAKRIVLRTAGVPKYIVGVVEDVTARKETEARIAYLAHHDPLTDLPHGAAFREHLDAVLEWARAETESFAVLRLDLDRFKEANDVFGQSAGDAALREVAARFRTAAEGAYLARSGGDEFALIADGPQPAGAEALAARLREAISGEIDVAGQAIQIRASIGIAVFPGDGEDAAVLMANADAALHRAKSDGRGTVRFFDSATDMRLRERRALQHELRAGVPGELMVHYQPQLRADGGLIGFEALLRWQHLLRGLLPAAQFISVAEDSGQIFAIGAWVLREACREAASWPGATGVAVNLSPLQFRQGNLPALVRATLSETGLPAERLELEVTESLLIDDHAGALAILRELKAIGVRIALDDFGTGYSSLSYLQSFPFDKIKIDRSFVSNLQNGAQSVSIVRAIIALAHGMNLPVLAEGVESDAQRAFLVQEGCDGLQGYLFGFPGPIEQYSHLFNSSGAHGPIVPDAA